MEAIFSIKNLGLSENQEFWFCSFQGTVLFSQYKTKYSRQKFIDRVNNFFNRPYRVEEELGLDIHLIPAEIRPNGWVLVDSRTQEVRFFVYTDDSMGKWKNAPTGVREHVLSLAGVYSSR